jgi:hypothetical protein|tara:strand:- start:114 stop:287 length:174 start_codon:yes stop_codon:yes gene_type:complete
MLKGKVASTCVPSKGLRNKSFDFVCTASQPGAPSPSNATQVTMVTALEPEMQNLREA